MLFVDKNYNDPLTPSVYVKTLIFQLHLNLGIYFFLLGIFNSLFQKTLTTDCQACPFIWEETSSHNFYQYCNLCQIINMVYFTIAMLNNAINAYDPCPVLAWTYSEFTFYGNVVLTDAKSCHSQSQYVYRT